MGTAIHNDKRIHKILTHLGSFTAGDYGKSLEISEKADEIDSISNGINQLGNALFDREVAIKNREERIHGLLDILLEYSVMDFTQRAHIGDSGDEIDALGAALNTLGEEVKNHTTQLKDSEEQIKTIFKNAPDAVVVIDSRGVVVRWNPAAAKIFGWGEEEVRGKFLHDVIIPERHRKEHIDGMAHFLKTGEGPILNKTVELPALCKNNMEIAIELTISPARVNEDFLFISFLRDVTERKKGEEQVRQLNGTLEQRVLERTEELILSEKKYRNLFENNPCHFG